MTSQAQHPHLPLPDYFSQFASIYFHQTGHSTLNILSDVITDNIQLQITLSTLIPSSTTMLRDLA
ncbi:hypothetical protein RRF57_007921 [Xylaria bambusicola]|uniref:Uncharacterized protein n=1 Tax=Xylaria bambusicola TaxID=326684 RepID=A0AAN7Z6N3_9PEZI